MSKKYKIQITSAVVIGANTIAKKDRVLSVPDDISDKDAKRLLERSKAVVATAKNTPVRKESEEDNSSDDKDSDNENSSDDEESEEDSSSEEEESDKENSEETETKPRRRRRVTK